MMVRFKNSEDGISYLTILFLLAILSALGLVFIQKANLGTAAAVTRGESMQAHYLAESAANHAMWRLLNETNFPAEQDKYYMHSLAGGRYGYKVRRHTATTFATVATVGTIGDHVIHQSYVMHVKPGTPAGGFYWFLNSDAKVIEPTQGPYYDVDLSSDSDIPEGATGVILEIVNENTSFDYKGQVRANGCVDYKTLRARIKESSQITAFVKLDENKTFEAFRNSTDIKFYVRGYTGDKVTFFTSYDTFDIGTEDVPTTIDLSGSGVPGNSIAILELYNGGAGGLGIRRKGDTDFTFYTQGANFNHQYIMVGLDANSMFEYFIDSSDSNVYQTIHLVGYMEDVGTWMPSPSADVSGSVTDSWVARDITPQTSANASVAFVTINNDYPLIANRNADLRATGSSDDQYSYAEHLNNLNSNIFYVVGLDDSQVFETKIETSDININVLGYQE